MNIHSVVRVCACFGFSLNNIDVYVRTHYSVFSARPLTILRIGINK